MKKLILIYLFFIFSSFSIDQEKPTIFLIGDSTCANKQPIDQPETGWGMEFSKLFTDAIEIQNHAVNGRSTKSFRSLGHWKTVQSRLKSGDYVFIQFGHNDQKESDTTRYAAAQTDYRKNIIRYIEETKAKGANPVLLTPVMRRKFDDNGKFIDQHGEYPQVVREIANQYHLPLFDAHKHSQTIIEQHGVEGSKKIFMHYKGGIFPKFPKGIEDNTHFSQFGASLMASMVANELVQIGHPLRSFLLKSQFQDKYLYELPKVYRPVFRKDTFNIVRYGAKTDGITLNTKAINQAIEMANLSGGGTVLIPKGLWLTGPITLKNNVNLHVLRGAVVQFTNNSAEFPLVKTNWEGVDAIRAMSPINGTDLENIAITGEGVFDGGGEAWRPVKKSKMTGGEWTKLVQSGGVLNDKKDTWYPTERALKGSTLNRPGVIAEGYDFAKAEEIKEFLRPNMLSLIRCKNILLEGFLIQNSPAWTIHPLLCEHLTLNNVKVKNPWYGQNNDALDLESCRNAIIENCSFDTGDDGICIKSGRDEEGRKRGVPTENVIVRNCTVFRGHGGFVIGSEMSGGVRNMYISDCNFLGTDVGLRFKTARGRGGIVEKIYIADINMTDIPGEAILFDMYYMAKDPVPQPGESNEMPKMETLPVNDGTPQFRDFYVQNVICKGAETGILVRGVPEMNVKNVWIQDSYIQSNKGFVCIEGENINLKNVTLLAKDRSTINIHNSKQITLDKIETQAGKEVFMKVSGESTKAIRVINTDTKKSKVDFELGQGVGNKVILKK